MTWTIERRSIPHLHALEEARVKCNRGHLAHKPTRIIRGATVTPPSHPCERCARMDAQRAVPREPKRRTTEDRIAEHRAKAGERLARVAEKAARQEEARKARQAREDKRARERLKSAERWAKAGRVARRLVKLWEAGELPPEVLKMLEVA